MSARRASPGPFTTQPIIATVIFLLIVFINGVISFTRFIKLTSVLPHVGHDINVAQSSYSDKSFNKCLHAIISLSGVSVKEILIVFPIPFNKRGDNVAELLINPNSLFPASVIPK